MDREVLILLLPKGTVASLGMKVVTHPRKWFSVIQHQNLIEILHTLCTQDILRAKNTLKVELCKAIDNLESFNSGLLVELIKQFENMNDNESFLEELRLLRSEVSQILWLIEEMKQEYSVVEEKIELSSPDVMKLLNISRASLYRWRETNAIPYRYVSCNHVAYPFQGLYLTIKTGRAGFKGFSSP